MSLPDKKVMFADYVDISDDDNTSQDPIIIDDGDYTILDDVDDVIEIPSDDDEDGNEDEDVQFISCHPSNNVAPSQVTEWDYPFETPVAPQAHHPARRARLPFTAYEPKKRVSDHGISFIEGHPMTETEWLIPGHTVELKPSNGSPVKYGDFLKISEIFEDEIGSVYLRGILYRRTKSLKGMLPSKLNEVYMVLHQNVEDDRDIMCQSLHDVSISEVSKKRCLRHTNKPYPEDSFRTTEDARGRSREEIVSLARLACRWKRIYTYGCEVDLMTGHAHERSIVRLTEGQCDQYCSVPDAVLRRAVVNVEPDISVVDLDAETAHDNDSTELADMVTKMLQVSPAENPQAMRNTFADFFCGAGGASIGAREAGFTVKYGVDFNKDACATMRLNFPGTTVFHESIHENLVGRKQAGAVVRCCHMSTVCKTISPAYTVRGKNHDANEATLFTISDILRKAKPMVATLEQTFGALTTAKQPIFNSFVWQFTAMGYSVRWAAHNLSEYGVPQARKRLVMIASCPGHPLPEFPKPTHGPHLRPFVTIAAALNPIRFGMANHDPDRLKVTDHSPYSPYQLLRGCITTSGGINNYHPNGRRNFTERELAFLQTFPSEHVFAGNRTSVKHQVGNAFPPSYTKALYEGVRKTFLEVDLADAEYDAEIQSTHNQSTMGEPIEID